MPLFLAFAELTAAALLLTQAITGATFADIFAGGARDIYRQKAAGTSSSGAPPADSSGAPPSGGSNTPGGTFRGSGGFGIHNLFPRGAHYQVGRTDAGVDFSGLSGPIGAIANGTIAAVRNYSGFGTTVFLKLDQPVQGHSYVYYALETGGSILTRRGRVAAGTPIARGSGGVIEVGLSTSADVGGIDQHHIGPGHLTRGGQLFHHLLGL